MYTNMLNLKTNFKTSLLNLIYLHKNFYLYIVIVIWRSPFRNLDEVFTYNHVALMNLKNRSHGKAFMVLTRTDHLFIYIYKRSLLNIN